MIYCRSRIFVKTRFTNRCGRFGQGPFWAVEQLGLFLSEFATSVERLVGKMLEIDFPRFFDLQSYRRHLIFGYCSSFKNVSSWIWNGAELYSVMSLHLVYDRRTVCRGRRLAKKSIYLDPKQFLPQELK